MFIMFNMHVHVCVHACMHAYKCVLSWGTPYTYTHPHPYLPTPSTPKGGNPPNQLKCYNT